MTMATIVTKTTAEQAVTTTRKAPSPLSQRVARPRGRTTGTSTPACAVIGAQRCCGRSTSRDDRPPVQCQLLQLVDALLLKILAQWLVVDSRGHVLAGGQHPGEEVDQSRCLGRVGLVLVDERPRRPGNGVRLRVARVGQVESQVRRVRDPVGGRQDRLVARLDERTRLVLHVRVGKMLRQRIAQLDVADGALSLPDGAGPVSY